MNRFVRHEGTAAPLMRPNIDTDIIAPLNRSRDVDQEPGALVFESLRYREDGSLNPDFVLNRPEYGDASILITGRNFGTGSSRESAVTGLLDIGIRCVIASSYGQIFYNNCFANGLLPVVLSDSLVKHIARLATVEPDLEISLDLESRSISHPGLSEIVHFDVDQRLQRKMLLGLDDLSEIFEHDDSFAGFQREDRGRRPWVYEW